MANLIFKQIPIHFFVKLLHKLQPPGGTIFHKSDPPFFWLKIIIGYVCTFCERPRLIQQHFLKTSHPNGASVYKVGIPRAVFVSAQLPLALVYVFVSLHCHGAFRSSTFVCHPIPILDDVYAMSGIQVDLLLESQRRNTV